MTRIIPRRVLVPIDFSDISIRAWDFAKGIFQPMGARIEAVHVHEIPAMYVEGMPPVPLADRDRQALAWELRKRLGGDAQVSVLEGSPSSAIPELAREREADLIVMGTHGRTGLPKVFFGSVAESVSRYSPVPVLTIRSRWRAIKSILVPLNFERYSLNGFFAAAELAEALGARMDALFVASGPPKKALGPGYHGLLRRLPSYFSRKEPKLLRAEGDPTKEIISAAAGYDLIVLVSHRKSFFHDWVLGTTAERVLRHSPIPVLAIPSGVKVQSGPIRSTSAARSSGASAPSIQG